MTDQDDANLVEQAQAGDRPAFDELARRHRPRLVRILAWMTGDADDAESLAQEALTRAFAQLRQFQRGQAFEAWLHGIGLNACRNFLRDRARHARPVEPERLKDVPARRQSALSDIIRQELSDSTWNAIGALPSILRESFVLHFVEGMNYKLMSEITGVAEGTLRVRSLRARTLLHQDLGPIVDTWMRQGPSSENIS
jgi:RNA polymerase sigma-70 factor (ECF subfamily)